MVIIVIWFFLGIWFWLTVAAAKLGQVWMRASFPEKKWAGAAGAFIGFMLLMGGWWVYWGIEYLQVRHYAKQMCQQAGVKVYITPEEWKEMVGGEEAWRRIKPINKLPPKEMQGNKIFFNGKYYKIIYQVNERVFLYERYEGGPYILLNDIVYFDERSKVVLYQYIDVNVGTGINITDAIKFWIPNMKCSSQQDYFLNLNKYFGGF